MNFKKLFHLINQTSLTSLNQVKTLSSCTSFSPFSSPSCGPSHQALLSLLFKLATLLLSPLFVVPQIVFEVFSPVGFKMGRLAMLGPHPKFRVLGKIKHMNRHKMWKQSLGCCGIASANRISLDPVWIQDCLVKHQGETSLSRKG